jgi:hypothetical protein
MNTTKRDSDPVTRPDKRTPFERFRDFTKQIASVPKDEADDQARAYKKRKYKAGVLAFILTCISAVAFAEDLQNQLWDIQRQQQEILDQQRNQELMQRQQEDQRTIDKLNEESDRYNHQHKMRGPLDEE